MTWTKKQLFTDIPEDLVRVLFGDIAILRNAVIGLLVLVLAYPVTHGILHRFNNKYQTLDANVQNTVLQHVVEAIFFTVSFPFITYLFLYFSFQYPRDENGVMMPGTIDRYRSLFVLVFAFLSMYMIEIVLRYRGLNPLVLFHHLSSIGLLIACIIFPTAAFFKVNVILVYFAYFEVLTFYGLVMKVLFPLHTATPRMMVAGMVLFGITRPVQFAWILIVMIGSWEDHVRWQAIFQIIASLVILVVQCAALKIHYAVWRRCVARQIAIADTTSSGVDDDQSSKA